MKKLIISLTILLLGVTAFSQVKPIHLNNPLIVKGRVTSEAVVTDSFSLGGSPPMNTIYSLSSGLPYLKVQVPSANLTDEAPTQSELVSLLGSASTAGIGYFTFVLDLNGTASMYGVVSTGTAWRTWPTNVAP